MSNPERPAMISAWGLGIEMDQRPTTTIRLNYQELREIAQLGVRRAHAFMAVGLQAIANGPPQSAALSSAFQFRFLPEPLPEKMGEEIAAEFEAWLVGAGLRELDHYFGLFADRLWFFISAADLHGTKVASSHVIGGTFHSNTNVSRKIARIAQEIGGDGIHQAYFDAFSRARNALGHGAGHVRDRDVGGDTTLRLQWLAPDIVVVEGQGDDARETPLLNAPFQVTDPNGAQVVMKIVVRERAFAVGNQIKLSPQNLSEICFFYSQQAECLVLLLEKWLISRGIAPQAKKQ